ncbi:MAG: hypothetical protein M3Z09_18135 [Acidobacteriota bacterium]|nr:hypothetical protein [Acidobacteriota bacterium]
MTIDERLEALTMNLELQAREGEAQRQRIDTLVGRIDALVGLIAADAENIRSLARIAERHERRLDQIQKEGL